MVDIISIIINAFDEFEMKDGRVKRKLCKKVFKEDKLFDELMSEKLNMKEHALYRQHEDDIVLYWTTREEEVVRFTLQFISELLSFGKTKKVINSQNSFKFVANMLSYIHENLPL